MSRLFLALPLLLGCATVAPVTPVVSHPPDYLVVVETQSTGFIVPPTSAGVPMAVGVEASAVAANDIAQSDIAVDSAAARMRVDVATNAVLDGNEHALPPPPIRAANTASAGRPAAANVEIAHSTTARTSAVASGSVSQLNDGGVERAPAGAAHAVSLRTGGSVEAISSQRVNLFPGLSARVSVGPTSNADGATHEVTVRVQGARPVRLPPPTRLNVHLLIDHSMSMQRTWPQLVEATEALIADLHPQDRLQIVAYSSRARVLCPLAPVGNGERQRRLLENLRPRGETNISSALELAYDAVDPRPETRTVVVLLSDGVPSQGETRAEMLEAMVASARDRGVTTSTVGIGFSFDEALLRSLSERGGGALHQVNIAELRSALLGEMQLRSAPVAHNLRARLNVPQGVEIVGGSGQWAQDYVDAGDVIEWSVRIRASSARGFQFHLAASAALGLPAQSAQLTLGLR